MTSRGCLEAVLASKIHKNCQKILINQQKIKFSISLMSAAGLNLLPNLGTAVEREALNILHGDLATLCLVAHVLMMR